jgi:transposase
MVEPIVKRCAGLDVHKMQVMVTVLLEQPDGQLQGNTREFGTFHADRLALAQWLNSLNIELVVMESTGIYWKSVFSTLEAAGLKAYIVNAHHVKQVPGRKTDVKDSQWLASLARFGLLKPSFIPPLDLRELRLVTRYRLKLARTLAGEKNRLHKVLDDAGIRLGGVVADINGTSAQAMIAGLIAGRSLSELIDCARGRMKAKREQLRQALDEPLSERHRVLLQELHHHIGFLGQQLSSLDKRILAAMAPYQPQWRLLQTLPGIDKIAAALVIAEIGIDMERFGSGEQFASWAGLCPGNNESASKRKSSRLRKGNQVLRQVLCEIANAACRTNSQFKGKYRALVIRRGHKRTIMALAHKLLRVIYAILKHQQPYRDPGIDYEALVVAKNAPRWLKALEKYGYLKRRQSVAV